MLTVKQIEQKMTDAFDEREAFQQLLDQDPFYVKDVLAELLADEGYRRESIDFINVSYNFDGLYPINFESFAELKQDYINHKQSIEDYIENEFYSDLIEDGKISPKLTIVNMEDFVKDITIETTQTEIEERFDENELTKAIMEHDPEEIQRTIIDTLRDEENINPDNVDLKNLQVEIINSFIISSIYEIAQNEQPFIEDIGDYNTYFNQHFYERLVTRYSVTVDVEIKNLEDFLTTDDEKVRLLTRKMTDYYSEAEMIDFVQSVASEEIQPYIDDILSDEGLSSNDIDHEYIDYSLYGIGMNKSFEFLAETLISNNEMDNYDSFDNYLNDAFYSDLIYCDIVYLKVDISNLEDLLHFLHEEE